MVIQKQSKLDEALRAGAASRPVNVDKLMTSTAETLINFKIEFKRASTPEDTLEDCGCTNYILLEPGDRSSEKEQCSNNSAQLKKNFGKGFKNRTFPKMQIMKNRKRKPPFEINLNAADEKCLQSAKRRRRKK